MIDASSHAGGILVTQASRRSPHGVTRYERAPGRDRKSRETTMPVPTRVHHDKNIWIAAGDGDLDRVRVSALYNHVHALRMNLYLGTR